MAQVTVRDVVDALALMYPPALAQDWDVNGLNVGSLESKINKVLFTVDVTKAVIEQAKQEKANLIISHHPLMLHPVSLVSEETQKGELISMLIKSEIALFNAHTNADVAPGGVNDCLAEVLGLTKVANFNEQGLGRIGELVTPVGLEIFAREVKKKLPTNNAAVLVSGELDKKIHKVAICAGAGDSLLAEVRSLNVDLYLTADLRHHPAQDNKELKGPALISVSHWASEWPWLKKCANELDLKLKKQGLSIETVISEINTDPWDLAL